MNQAKIGLSKLEARFYLLGLGLFVVGAVCVLIVVFLDPRATNRAVLLAATPSMVGVLLVHAVILGLTKRSQGRYVDFLAATRIGQRLNSPTGIMLAIRAARR